MLLVQSVTSNNQQDYFLIKELTEAAMVDAVDFAYYRQYGEVRINKEKFYETFLRRFAENATLTNTYTISFYDVYEAPPKVSVEVKGKSGTFSVVGDSTQFDIVNRIDAILEGNVIGNTPEYGNNSSDNNSNNNNVLDNNTVDNIADNSSAGNENNSDNTGASSRDGIAANKLSPKSKSNNEITVELTVTSDNKVKEYYFSNDDGKTWQKSNENYYTFSGLNENVTYKFKAYAVDEKGNTSNQVTISEKTSSNVTTTSCLLDEENITSKALEGKRGTPMLKLPLYKKFTEYDTDGNVTAGTIFTILGSRIGANNKEWWAIKLDNDKCGWIDSTTAAISLKDYAPEIRTNITNSSGSIYKSSGYDLPGITGKQLYSSQYSDFVPVVYSFATKLKQAAANASSGGDTLVVMDAYRPKSVSTAASKALNKLMSSNATVAQNINYSTGASGRKYHWGIGYFLAQGLSAHNVACAVDITLASGSMPSEMHELSTKAIKYFATGTSGESNYSVGMLNSSAAQKLSKYMMGAGLKDLASEWWHYQDQNCYTMMKSKLPSGANFWSNI